MRFRAGLATTAMYASLMVGCAVALLPLVVVAMTSLKTSDEYTSTPPFAPPSDWLNFGNYGTAFTDGRMLLGYTNTAIILAVSLVGTVLIGSMAAYALDRFAFRLRRVILGLFLVATLVPGVTTQWPRSRW